MIAVEFGVRRPLYDVIPERPKGDCFDRQYRYIAHFVERSYPTLKGRVRPLAVPGGPIWATYLEKEAGKCPHMTHNHLTYPGPNPGKLYPSFCAGSLPAHISPLNTGYGGTAALHYRRITPYEHPGGLFAPARPFTHIGGGFHRESSKTGSVGFHTFSGL